ncbi:MAG: zinc/manganese transport system substrate-binding protein [Chloroflexota bacterium]|nr:zinc/manganese transport system substrate-binding protein [Chloroflexota bacterium]
MDHLRNTVPNAMRLSRSRAARTALVVIVALVFAACGPGAGSAGPVAGSGGPSSGTKLNVVTTTTVFADIVQNVGGSRVSVTSIIPPGVGPEDYEAKPEDARKLAGAQLIVSNGVGLDDFLDRLLTSAGGDQPRLVLGDGIPVITVDGEPNPHFWLDPTLVRDHYVPAIAARLTALDPEGKAAYDANAAAYSATLDTLDADLKTKVEEIPAANRKLVTFHDAFPYFAKHYGFELVGVILANVGQEPTAGELAALVEKVKAAGVTAVFSEAQFSPKLAETLAQEAGVTKVVTTLYNDALGPAPADTYVGLMRWNVDQIVAALR